MTTIDNIMTLAYKLRDARIYEWDVSEAVEAGKALRTALTELFDQLDIQAGSIEAVQAVNQRLAAIIQNYPEKDISAQPVREPANWYCIDKSGMATLCADEDDALQSAKLAALDWPNNAPYRAVQLVETTTRGIGGGK